MDIKEFITSMQNLAKYTWKIAYRRGRVDMGNSIALEMADQDNVSPMQIVDTMIKEAKGPDSFDEIPTGTIQEIITDLLEKDFGVDYKGGSDVKVKIKNDPDNSFLDGYYRLTGEDERFYYIEYYEVTYSVKKEYCEKVS